MNQIIENKFFSLLNSFVEFSNLVRFREHDNDMNDYKGFYYFQRFYNIYKTQYYETSNVQREFVKDEKEYINITFNNFYKNKSLYVGKYFNQVYQLLYFIDELKEEKSKESYIRFFKSQLSDYEILLLFYFGLCNMSMDLKKFLEKYKILQYINVKELIDIGHLNFYKQYQSESD